MVKDGDFIGEKVDVLVPTVVLGTLVDAYAMVSVCNSNWKEDSPETRYMPFPESNAIEANAGVHYSSSAQRE
jgi:hypothetical protein